MKLCYNLPLSSCTVSRPPHHQLWKYLSASIHQSTDVQTWASNLTDWLTEQFTQCFKLELYSILIMWKWHTAEMENVGYNSLSHTLRAVSEFYQSTYTDRHTYTDRDTHTHRHTHTKYTLNLFYFTERFLICCNTALLSFLTLDSLDFIHIHLVFLLVATNVWFLPERRSSADNSAMLTGKTLHRLAAKERVMFQTNLPEVLAYVTRFKVELNGVLVKPLQVQVHCNTQTQTDKQTQPNALPHHIHGW